MPAKSRKRGVSAAERYQVGQVWTFADAPLPDSKVIIGSLDDIPQFGLVVSISVINVPVDGVAPGSTDIIDIEHAPMAPEFLDECLIDLIGFHPPPRNFETLRNNWLEANAKEGAGIFTIGVRDLISIYQDGIRQMRSGD